LYTEQTGHREFKIAECYEMLQQLPKFDPMKSTLMENSSGLTTNCDGKIMGEGILRHPLKQRKQSR
jgi:hypothetical protein